MPHQPEEREANDGVHDGPNAKAPSEADSVEDRVCGRAVAPSYDEPGGGSVCDPPSSVTQTAGIGNENGNGEVDSAVAELVKDLSSTVGSDVVAASHHDEAEDGGSDHESETLGTAPDIEDLSVGKFPESTDQT